MTRCLAAASVLFCTLALAQTPDTVVDVAGSSKSHTTLVAALKAADYVRSLQNAGPFTVFAPTNEAFAAVPKETLDNLLKPENKEALQNVLKYHVAVSVYETRVMKEGMKLGVANGANVVFHVKDGQAWVNDAKIVASVRAGNGIVHVIDRVLLPPAK
ncbi:MAG: osteoblast specific factor 2-related protein [Myxococcaceae bacterium]